MPGFPIRTPSDQRSVDSSPRTIAASHVLHRLLVPRHPPCALDNLTNTHIKKSRHKYSTETKDARVHCTILNDHTNRGRTPPHGDAGPDRPTEKPTTPAPKSRPVVLSGPNSVPPTRNPAGLSGVSTISRATPLPRPTVHSTTGQVLGALHQTPRPRRTLACEPPELPGVR